MTVDDIIKVLELKKLPEGGWYKLTAGRERGRVHPFTGIYLLLTTDDFSPWHRTEVSQIWHYYAGAPLSLKVAATSEGPAFEYIVGPDILLGQRPQQIVPEGWWRSAKPIGEYTLLGSTSNPGFNRDDFEIAPPDFDIPMAKDSGE